MEERKARKTISHMNNFLEQETLPSAPSSESSQVRSLSSTHRRLRLITWAIAVLALIAGIMLLASDLFLATLPHAPISAAPLLLIGAAYLAFQAYIRSGPLDLFRALIVSAAFILWGIDQMLPSGWFAMTLGDIVIMLYVIDLAWLMIDRLKQRA